MNAVSQVNRERPSLRLAGPALVNLNQGDAYRKCVDPVQVSDTLCDR